LDRLLFKREDLNENRFQHNAINQIPSLENIYSVTPKSSDPQSYLKRKKDKLHQHTKVVPSKEPSMFSINDIKDSPNNDNNEPSIIEDNINLQDSSCNKRKRKTVITEKLKNTNKCTCTNSKCLRLYCACFANGTLCGPECQCHGCHNNDSTNELRDKIIQETLQKNPNAFKSKYKKHAAKDAILHVRGCNCSKTGCIKEYCECFKIGAGCSKLCRCVNCKNSKVDLNTDEVKDYYVKVIRKRNKTKFFEKHFGNPKKDKYNKENEKCNAK